LIEGPTHFPSIYYIILWHKYVQLYLLSEYTSLAPQVYYINLHPNLTIAAKALALFNRHSSEAWIGYKNRKGKRHHEQVQ